MFKSFMFGIVAVALTVSTTLGQAVTLKVGDPAPTLAKAVWIKGSPSAEWSKDHIYVLDFWATWCGPCIASIPHLNDLHKKYESKNVHVIGVAIWPRVGQKPTKDFVEARGDAMGYAIAEDVDNALAAAFMDTTGSNGIPTAMIIDGEGRLVWIGHPASGMEKVLESVVTGTFDIDAEKKAAERKQMVQVQAEGLISQFRQAQAASEWEKLVEIADKMLALDAEQFAQAGIAKYFVLLVELKDSARASAAGRGLVEGAMKDSPEFLNAMAWMIATEDGIPSDSRDFGLALMAAKQAVELSKGGDASILDTLARVHFERGEIDQAIGVQTKAVELEGDTDQATELKASLAKYVAAKNRS